MVVSDSILFPPSNMKVRITSLDGRDYLADLHQEWSVDKVKIMSLSHFFNPAESMKTSLYHKLVHVRSGKVLDEEQSLAQEGVRDNDELLLLKRRLPPSPFDGPEKAKADGKKEMDMETIRRMTADVPKSTCEAADDSSDPAVDFQTELRRILISLIEASQRILCMNPAAAKIFKQAEEILNEPPRPSQVDDMSLKQLVDMGFPEARARKALMLNKMNVMPAMEWLFQHEDDPDIDAPLPGEEETTPQTPEEQPEGAIGGKENPDGTPKVTNILESLRAFRKREFRPNARALQKLLEMGFSEQEATDALRVSRNDQDAACEWLLGDRQTRPETVDDGLDPDSPVYKAILANPTVQLGLNNPRCLLAFLQMLESPMSANQWLNDSETGPILIQISRIYHAEKNSKPRNIQSAVAS
ncbi:ubiquitin-associated domain-containing protein 1-like [Haliotis rufescens]|uniref:ubiquitin-associated domain-containing protein 1-like n=1 Tax=Haliotis rufescens TaxID=6454 RepID=UPI001EAF9051|nr:ubiquitin-associated domain-containing protein 1-like [Haliotis rufescens]